MPKNTAGKSMPILFTVPSLLDLCSRILKTLKNLEPLAILPSSPENTQSLQNPFLDTAASSSFDAFLNKAWIEINDLLVNAALFYFGIMAITVRDTEQRVSHNESSIVFGLGSRTYHLKKFDPINEKVTRKPLSLLNKMQQPYTGTLGLFNHERREEVFFPHKTLGLYVNPWVSHGTLDKFSGFEQFITAGCMFGALLEAQNFQGKKYPLIKHDHEFSFKEKIARIIFNPRSANPYEEMFFYELARLAKYINTTKKIKNIPGNLLVHVPYCDYMLFGIELFIRGRITLKALNHFFSLILEKKEIYAKKINQIASDYNIVIQIKSPFENLITGLSAQNQPSGELNIASRILENLQLSLEEIKPETMDVEQQRITESNFVLSCLHRLTTNESLPNESGIWKDLSANSDNIQTLEDLLKIGNAFIVAYGAFKKDPYTTCVCELLTEKQIQLSYSSFAKSNSKYPPVVNLTCLDPVIAYAPEKINKDLLFYSGENLPEIADLITKGLLEKAHDNASLQASDVQHLVKLTL